MPIMAHAMILISPGRVRTPASPSPLVKSLFHVREVREKIDLAEFLTSFIIVHARCPLPAQLNPKSRTNYGRSTCPGDCRDRMKVRVRGLRDSILFLGTRGRSPFGAATLAEVLRHQRHDQPVFAKTDFCHGLLTV